MCACNLLHLEDLLNVLNGQYGPEQFQWCLEFSPQRVHHDDVAKNEIKINAFS